MIRVPHPMQSTNNEYLEAVPIGDGKWRLTIMRRGRTQGSIVLNETSMAKIAFHVYNQIDWQQPVESDEDIYYGFS